MADNAATEVIAPEVVAPKVVPKYRGYYVQKKWYCDCLLEAICRQVKMKESSYYGMKFWSCPKVENEERCGMWMLDSESTKAKDWLAHYGPDTPDLELFQKPVKRTRIAEPRTPPRKLSYAVNPFTMARMNPKRQRRETTDNGEGRAPALETDTTESTEEEVVPTSSEEAQEESDDAVTEQHPRYSPSTPVPNAPRKRKAQVAFVTPTRPVPTTERSFLERLQAAKSNEEAQPDELAYEPRGNSLPTPETGHRTKLFEPRKLDEAADSRAIESITSSLLYQLNSPINLADSEHNATPTSSADQETPSKQPRSRPGRAKAKEQRIVTEDKASDDLTSVIMAILRSEGHVLKESTRYQLEHEVEVAGQVKETKIQACEKTIERLRARLDELEETVSLLTGGGEVDGVIELSD